MVQDQLVDYISSQLKLGVSREEVHAALVGAGWQAADVDDTLKKVAGDAAKAPAAKAFPSTAGGAAAPVAGAEPHSLRLSDLVSAGGSSAAAPAAAKEAEKGRGVFSRGNAMAGGIGSPASNVMAAGARTAMGAKKGGHAATFVWIILVLALGGLSGYLYFQNSGLASKIASVNGESTDVAAQISSLNGNIAALDASNTALAAQADELAAQNADLLANLSFVAVPAASSAVMGAAQAVLVAGMLTKTRTTYALATKYGVTVYVKNAADAAVADALKLLAGSTSTVTLSGTHVPGSAYLTVTAVNGAPVGAQAASSTPGQSP